MKFASQVTIHRVLHAGYVFESNEVRVIFDPVFESPFSRNCFAFPKVEFNQQQIKQTRFDAVFISHYHDDHCSFESLNLIDRSTPIYIFCVIDEMISLIEDLGFKNVFSLKLDEPILVGSFEIIPRRALDADVDSIFHIKVSGLNILNVVDSWIDQETLNLLNMTAVWDLILWPFQTMREIEVIAPRLVTPASTRLPDEWMEQLKQLNPRFIVPSSCQFIQESWSWYNHVFFPITYRTFAEQIRAALPTTQVCRLNPSVGIELDQNNLRNVASLEWVLPVGEQDVDYDYQFDFPRPTTASVAQQFEQLTSQQVAQVYHFCENELLKRYQAFEDFDDFFEKTRNWRLVLYDHAGLPKVFNYRLEKASISLVESTPHCEWLTEIPLAKLYAALFHGESLTSLYIRINDKKFDNEIEKKITKVDIADDPLIRSVFTGNFGAYQKAQLKRLKKISKA